MQEKLRKLQEGRKGANGFTLIELLIVIVILGVLAGIVVFAVSAFNNDGKAAACKADYKNVEIASEAYFAKQHAGAADIATLVTAGYLKEAPSTTNGYTITLTGGSPTSAGAVAATGACTLP
jgi:prepilin-type N-terminal cleavage/methylation domain-containing protein